MDRNAVFALLLAAGTLGFPGPARAQTCSANVPHVTGTWVTQPYLMPINPISATLLHTGNILIVAGSENDADNYSTGAESYRGAIWDPSGTTESSITVQNLTYDVFCSGTAVLPDGRALVVGGTSSYAFTGDNRASIFDPATEDFVQSQSMADGRWYGTVTALGDGRLMAFSGINPSGGVNNSVEIYSLTNAGAGWTSPVTAPFTPPLFPRMMLLPNGTVFFTGQGSGTQTAKSWRFNPANQQWTSSATTTGVRQYGSAVLLPLLPPSYRPQVMNLGGSGQSSTEIIDLSAPSPRWTPGPSMSTGRIEMNAVILPNGKVLAEGGSVTNEIPDTPGKTADLYDPVSNSFSSGGTASFSRLYHSTALLLPDATVMSMGSNPGDRGGYEPAIEIYTPPYLFDANDQLITNRPTITGTAPALGVVGYNAPLSVTYTSASPISSAVLVRPGADTHGFDMDQRLIGLCGPSPQPPCSGSGTLNLTTPPNGNIAPPGYYMLFLLDSAGVPSTAQFIQLSPYTTTPPSGAITSPASDVTIPAGGSVAFGTSTAAAQYSWNFPSGSPATSVAQTPGNVTFNTPGSYVASLTVIDASGNSDPSPPTRTITVMPTTPDFSIVATPSASEVVPGQSATFTVTVTPISGFTGTVSLSVGSESGFPTGITSGGFSPASIAGSGSATLTMNTTASATPYALSLTITGTSGSISHAAATTLLVNIPPPLALTATAGNAQVSLSWPASLGASSYTVQRALVSGGPYVTVGCPTTITYTDTGLTNGTTYYYVVAGAYTGDPDAGGGSASSPEASATPQQVPLTSIAVTPSNPTVTVGGTQQFTATGTYSDGSTQNLTGQVTWASSNTGTATISPAGLATAVASGTTTISATLGAVSGSTGLTVTAGPLTITTTALPAATAGVAYTATLTATGGTPPYTWSIATGTLPAGLTLTPATGVISGTPTATGTSSFTVKVAAGAQSVTKALGITVNLSLTTIWPSNPTPAIVDGGDTNPVTLGVKFQSDVAGVITGLRFYKAGTNTGSHVGILWSSTGQSLATVGFTGETSSGWQQANFASPVAIQANTVYVASYFAPNGHYSGNLNYFATQGTDTPPLHALATGVAGGNGVFGYGAAGTFPTSTYQALNYWVDVVFSAQPAPTLTSITVAPASATLTTGTTQQYTATGTYSDSSTQNLTSQVTWASSNTAAATINSAGLATGVAAGTTTILATLGSVSGSTGLTVTPGALSITTTALPVATVGAAYTATLAATGGTPPYMWFLASGTLPAGLTLASSTGVISGTPTATGTSSFSLEVTDPAWDTATAPLSITVSSSTTTIWPSNPTPAIVDGGDPSPVAVGVKFQSDVAGSITGLRFYKATANTGTHVGTLWSSTGQSLGTVTFTGETGSGWQQASFATPVAIQPNTVYVASYFAPSGHYSGNLNYFATQGVDTPPLHALATGVAGGDGVYGYGGSGTFPAATYQALNYWVDVVFSALPAPTLTSITVAPANATVVVGVTQQYTATGTYSDSSTQNLTSQVTWASSNTTAATISAAGLATAVTAGSTTISATLGSVSGSTGLTVTPGPLTITTATLPAATVGAAYTATLAATGGTPPYSWSIASGTLPAGLTLAAGSGVISGTPTATGTSSFTVQVTAGAQSVTSALSITVNPSVTMIWPTNPTPAIVDGGDTLAVALGVKFQSDVAGFIKGLRFYKAATNTGTHVGRLWSSTGQSLGTVSFTGETGTGWQQVSFATPIAIQANTVYVASYFAPNGHYSGDLNYFATQGFDTPPLHALASGVAGGNGVYGYGAAGTFPTSTYQALNYWVDVVFSTSAQ